MMYWLANYKKTVFGMITMSVLIPILFTGYVIVFRGEDSVTYTFSSPVGYLIVSYYILLIVICISLLFYWVISQIKIIQKLKTDKTKAELSHLKAQINPHFFFNMLNNLYGWIDKDTTQAKELILKLSDMMRYSIYEGQKDMVLLTEEIDFLKNYIELNRIRYQKKIEIYFSIDIENKTLKIMPLMFIILIENAFKHGVEKLRDNAFVNITLKTNDKGVEFEIKNNFEEDITTFPGIGLENLKSRLDIVYTNRYELKSNIENGIYSAQLILTT